MVAACRTALGKVLIIIDIHADIQSSSFSQFQKEKAEKRSCRTTSNYGYTRTTV
jgi:hypothetical protein